MRLIALLTDCARCYLCLQHLIALKRCAWLWRIKSPDSLSQTKPGWGYQDQTRSSTWSQQLRPLERHLQIDLYGLLRTAAPDFTDTISINIDVLGIEAADSSKSKYTTAHDKDSFLFFQHQYPPLAQRGLFCMRYSPWTAWSIWATAEMSFCS